MCNQLTPTEWERNWDEHVQIGNGVFIDINVTCGDRVFIGHNVVIREGVTIGSDVCIGHNSTIEENVFIGNGVRIQAGAYITKNTKIHDKVFIGPCVVTSNDWDILSHGRPGEVRLEGPEIKFGARIGAGALLMPGITVGENALVGAGSVVSKDVAPRDIVHGVRAEVTGQVAQEACL